MGAFFAQHPNNPNVRKATVDVVNKNHPASRTLPDHWDRYDEWYNYTSFYPGIKVLANLDENSKITDNHGAIGRDTVVVKAGNTPPEVEIASTDNRSFLWKDKPFKYSLVVKSDRSGNLQDRLYTNRLI